ncbi:MAG: helix-turn-helix domain-containing protein [Planctomycetota bacterium]
MNRVYTSGKAAAICGLSLSTLKRWIVRGALRAYRTPGGDIRIPHEELCDFMRQYDMPFQRLAEEETRILLSVKELRFRTLLLKEIRRQLPDPRIEFAEGSLDLGFALARFHPWAVILSEENGTHNIFSSCDQIRKFLAPQLVRIGFIGNREISPNTPMQPDAILGEKADAEEIRQFIENLLGGHIIQGDFQIGKRKHSA